MSQHVVDNQRLGFGVVFDVVGTGGGVLVTAVLVGGTGVDVVDRGSLSFALWCEVEGRWVCVSECMDSAS